MFAIGGGTLPIHPGLGELEELVQSPPATRQRCVTVLPPTIPMFESFSIVVEWVEHNEIATCDPDDGFATARPIPAIGVS
jgi:hypothetical protein